MKKHLAMLLAAALLLCAAPLTGFTTIDWPEIHSGSLFPTAQAAEIVDSGDCGAIDKANGLDGSQVTWTLDSDGLLTISGSGAMKDFDKDYAPWYSDTDVKSVSIQNTVTAIGSFAFYSCNRLTSVTIPDSVTSIGAFAFYGCSKLTSVILPGSVSAIETGVFKSCEELTSVTIPDGVSAVGAEAFEDCTKLTSITFPDSVKSIGGYAFYGSGLTSFTERKVGR